MTATNTVIDRTIWHLANASGTGPKCGRCYPRSITPFAEDTEEREHR